MLLGMVRRPIKREISQEVENRTEYGLKFISGIMVLAPDLFTRNKEDMQEWTRP